MFRCRWKDSGRCILNMLKYVSWWSVSVIHTEVKYIVKKSNLEVMKACTSISTVSQATDKFLYVGNVSKVVKVAKEACLNGIRLTVTRYFIDMNVSHGTQMFLQYSSQIVETKPFPMNFLLNFSHSLFTHLFSLKSATSFPNVIWSTGTTVIPKLTLGKGKRTQVLQDLWRVL